MKRFSIPCYALLASALLHAQLTVPRLGVVRYPNGSVHIVHGIGANMIPDAQRLATADAASFSDSVGLLSLSGLIRLRLADGALLGEYQADEPAPLLHVDSAATSAIVWLPSKHLFLAWNGANFTETVVDDSSFGGPITFVNLASSAAAQFFVTRPDLSVARITVALPSGRVTSSDIEPDARGWIFVQQGWRISQDDRGLVAERRNGNRQTIQLSSQALSPTDLRAEQMSDHWVHVSSQSTGTNWALYLDQTKLNVFLLPPPSQKRLLAPLPPAHEVSR